MSSPGESRGSGAARSSAVILRVSTPLPARRETPDAGSGLGWGLTESLRDPSSPRSRVHTDVTRPAPPRKAWETWDEKPGPSPAVSVLSGAGARGDDPSPQVGTWRLRAQVALPWGGDLAGVSGECSLTSVSTVSGVLACRWEEGRKEKKCQPGSRGGSGVGWQPRDPSTPASGGGRPRGRKLPPLGGRGRLRQVFWVPRLEAPPSPLPKGTVWRPGEAAGVAPLRGEGGMRACVRVRPRAPVRGTPRTYTRVGARVRVLLPAARPGLAASEARAQPRCPTWAASGGPWLRGPLALREPLCEVMAFPEKSFCRTPRGRGWA